MTMGKEVLTLLLVPGRNDRAFYKSFFMKVSRELRFKSVDMDSEEYRKEKYQVLSRVYPHIEESPIRRSSIIRLVRDAGKTVYVIIWPTEEEVTQKAKDILGEQAGLVEPTIDTLVVAEDVEDMSFSERLESLYNSIASYKYVEVEKEIERGTSFRSYLLRKPRGVKLILLVQGIYELNISDKHAIEDYILYPYMDIIHEIESRCHYIIDRVGRGRHTHKKIALLVAIYKCYTGIEELFYRSLGKKELNTLIQKNDGLRKIIDIVTQ